MTKDERSRLLSALEEQWEKDDFEDWLFFARLMAFTCLCFFGALFIAAVWL